MGDNKVVHIFKLIYDSLENRYVFSNGCYDYTTYDEYNNTVKVPDNGEYILDEVRTRGDLDLIYATVDRLGYGEIAAIQRKMIAYKKRELSNRIEWTKTLLSSLENVDKE